MAATEVILCKFFDSNDNFNENRHNHIHIFRDRGNGKLSWQLTCRKPFIPYDDYIPVSSRLLVLRKMRNPNACS